MSDEILRVEDLSTRFFTEKGQVNAVSNLDLSIEGGEVFGIVGESGSGKSVLARSVMGLIESPGEITSGTVEYRNEELAAAVREDNPDAVDGEYVDLHAVPAAVRPLTKVNAARYEWYVDLRAVPAAVRRGLRGSSFSMIFQDPESSFNPSLTVGEQIAEAVEVQQQASARPRSTAARTAEYSLPSFVASTVLDSQKFITSESRAEAVELLDEVGIPDPAERAQEYPHEYSGGMLQRAMIAQALAGEPDVLVADEPTTALDVTIQAQILDILRDLQAEIDMTILLITHNLGVIARMCDRVGVMYAGEIVERGTLADIFDNPVHPYTQGLLGSIPDLDAAEGRLQPIEGNVPSLLDEEMDDRCQFADRCPKAMAECLETPPEFPCAGSDHHQAKCYLADHEYEPDQRLPEGYFESEAIDRLEAGDDD